MCVFFVRRLRVAARALGCTAAAGLLVVGATLCTSAAKLLASASFLVAGIGATGLLIRVRPRGIRGKPPSVDTESLPSSSLSSVADPASWGLMVRSSSAMLSLAKSF